MEVDDMYTENEQEEAELEENVSTDIIFQTFAIVTYIFCFKLKI